jgi:hypothetical protein
MKAIVHDRAMSVLEGASVGILGSLRMPAARLALVAALGLPSDGLAHPGGTPDLQTDVAPYCASCHSSTSELDLSGLGGRARSELAVHKHLATIRAGLGRYEVLSGPDREKLVEQLVRIDRNSTIELELPASVEPGETFRATVRVTGGAGPVVGVGLVDRPHRFFARPASAVGWQVVGAPTVIGPEGPQSAWVERRPERAGRNITFVNIEGVRSSVDPDEWSRAKVVFTLKAPEVVGDYPIVGAYFYGTETASSLSTRIPPEGGVGPLGGASGQSGRIKFSPPATVRVQSGLAVPPVAAISP